MVGFGHAGDLRWRGSPSRRVGPRSALRIPGALCSDGLLLATSIRSVGLSLAGGGSLKRLSSGRHLRLTLLLAATGTALGDGPRRDPGLRPGVAHRPSDPACWGIAAGVMTVASIVGLLRPALDQGSVGAVAAGLTLGVAFLAGQAARTKRRRAPRC